VFYRKLSDSDLVESVKETNGTVRYIIRHVYFSNAQWNDSFTLRLHEFSKF